MGKTTTYHRLRIGLLVGALIVMLQLSARLHGVQAQGQNKRPECSQQEDFQAVRGQGRACRTRRGTWKVLLRDGSIVETHGPDGGAAVGVRQTASPGAGSHVCVSDLAHDYHGLVIYAYSADQPDNGAAIEPSIRESVQLAQDLLQLEAQQVGVTASYKLACADDGRVRIDKARLATPYHNTDFGSIVSDLKAQGYTSAHAKYWVWFDGRPPAVSGYCGQGGIYLDETGSVENLNNGNGDQPGFAISYGCGGSVLMHEATHAMGGVQLGTPNASGGWHCNDGLDVMCYPDGGSRAGEYSPEVCTDREHFDCGGDDYFSPNPAPGSYLASHWNLGACYNRFIQRSGCGEQPAGTLSVQYKTPRAGATANDISPWFQIVNRGASPVRLSELSIRYWYTADATAPTQVYACDWAAVGCSTIQGRLITLSAPRSGADHYLELRFLGSGQIAANSASGEIQNRFHRSDWSHYTQAGDYSFDPTKTSYSDWSKVTLYRNGTLVWGTEP